MAQTIPQRCGESHDCTHEDHRMFPTSSPMRRASSPTAYNFHLERSDGSATLSSRVSRDQPSVKFFDFVEQSQLALQSLRLSFERERAAFAEERKLWEKERSIMRHRIAELEQGQRRTARVERTRMASHPHRSERAHDVHHVWEGSSPTMQPTRVFWDENEEQSPQGLRHPSGHNHGVGLPPSLDEALSPRARPVDRQSTVGVPIELVDSSLDGITLKSTALGPDILAKASSASPSEVISPSPDQTMDSKLVETKKPVPIARSELGPPQENLVRDAGHTPMTVIDPGVATSNISTEVGTLTTESPLAPRQTLEPGETYSPEVDEDPALQGPLGLKNDKKQDIEFLEALDQKLLNEARRLAGPGPTSHSDELENNLSDDEQPLSEPEPETGIKFKHSTNFGSAFGTL
ncbi:uncharacterized protein BDCG_02154 [Blastomyces dermatitidis ER-3]|uniref:Uncharacterized protein n=2 Tax=Ajellomyces dermatitidis TaxID=5039 RepID=F2T9B5_AJEDA|nr:uncharacterized protein BDCG_02154 [Blastomyces dermatitidis ER-3]EEQ87034.1 hypothetical protein BDCG_02154 [Blastomyces dermatitidis ER-3]EGE79828.1 hypothetical protein BDDG_02769 [Blastomyces dermatitidis ATCC 18188]EQL33248.1 hypothetical protein BDFG_04691 [Blastomyces dermatitidis ATCC 26199]